MLDKNKIEYRESMSRGLLINQLFKIAEEKLIQPIFIIDHPKETTPLCRLHRENPELIERFEPYINGWEIGNAYSELNDPIRQRYLLEEQAKELRAGIDAEANPMDEDFCKAIDHGFPPTGGLGLGVDRMIMLFTDSASIRDVIFFPTMKPHEETLPKENK
jgi:lysyl-tRNA synthetase class 2